MLAILFFIFFISLSPATQIKKARDTQRRHDIWQIKNALDAYYNDRKCYPQQSISIPFGGSWEENGTVYMKKVPYSPGCNSSSCNEYVYITDSSSCPQWYAIFVNKETTTASSTSDCGLLNLSNCTPSGSISPICAYGGSVDCSVISSRSLPESPTPTQNPTPTGCVKNYSCRGTPPLCNLVSPPGSGDYCTSNCDGACHL